MSSVEREVGWVYVEVPGFGFYKVPPSTGVLLQKAVSAIPPGNPALERLAEVAMNAETRLFDPPEEEAKFAEPLPSPDTTLTEAIDTGAISPREANEIRLELERRTAELKRNGLPRERQPEPPPETKVAVAAAKTIEPEEVWRTGLKTPKIEEPKVAKTPGRLPPELRLNPVEAEAPPLPPNVVTPAERQAAIGPMQGLDQSGITTMPQDASAYKQQDIETLRRLEKEAVTERERAQFRAATQSVERTMPQEETVPQEAPKESGGASLKDYEAWARSSASRLGPSAVSPTDVQRVANEIGPNLGLNGAQAYAAAAELLAASSDRRYTGPEETAGEAFTRGMGEGLLHPFALFGFEPDDRELLGPGGQPVIGRHTGIAAAAGSFLGATPGFVAASALSGGILGGVGLASRMTPLAYNLTRSAVAGALLGAGATPPDELDKLGLNMAKEAALWMAFDAGILAVSGKMSKMATEGRQIRGVRRQVAGKSKPGDFNVPPVYLNLERHLHPNTARNTREVANRVFAMYSVDPKNPYVGAARILGASAKAQGGVTRLDMPTRAEAEELKKGLEAAGLASARHGNQVIAVVAPDLPLGYRLVDRMQEFATVKGLKKEKPLAWKTPEGATSDKSIISQIRYGIANKRGAPPLEVEIIEQTGGGVSGKYLFSLGNKGLVQERKIQLTLDPSAPNDEILSVLAHEATHDALLMTLGRNPGKEALIEELLSVAPRARPVRAGAKSYKGVRIEYGRINGKTGARFDRVRGVILVDEAEMKNAFARAKAGQPRVKGVDIPPGITDSYDDFYRFMLEHEYQHRVLGEARKGETKAAYENRINRAAEEQVARQAGSKRLRAELETIAAENMARRRGISVKEARKILRSTPEMTTDFELLSGLTEYFALNSIDDALRLAPRASRLWADHILSSQPLLAAVIEGERTMTQQTANKLLEQVARDIAGGKRRKMPEITSSFTVRWRDIEARQIEFRKQMLRQFEKHGGFEGMQVKYNGRFHEFYRRIDKNHIVIREQKPRAELNRHQYKTVRIDDVQFPTFQNALQIADDVVKFVDDVIKMGMPHTLGVTVQDGNALRRLVFRTKDLIRVEGDNAALENWLKQQKPFLQLQGWTPEEVARAAAKTAREQGYQGILLDEGLGVRVITTNAKEGSVIHHFYTDPNNDVLKSIDDVSFEITGEDVITQQLFQAGVPLEEAQVLGALAQGDKVNSLWKELGREFTYGYDESLRKLAEIDKSLEALNLGGADDAIRSGMIYEQFPDGSVLIKADPYGSGQPGGTPVQKFPNMAEAKRYVAYLDQTAAPQFGNRVKGLTETQTRGLEAVGGARPRRPGDTLEDLGGPSVQDRVLNEFKRWAESPSDIPDILAGKASNFLSLKDRVFTFFTAMKPVAQAYEKRGYGAAYSVIYEGGQRGMNTVKRALIDPAAFNGKSFKDRIMDFRRGLLDIPAERRAFITQLNMTATYGGRPGVEQILGRKLNPVELQMIDILEQANLGDQLPEIISGYYKAMSWARKGENLLTALDQDIKAFPTADREFIEQVLKLDRKAWLAKSELERAVDLAALSGSPKDHLEIMRWFDSAVVNKQSEINLLAVSRYFSQGELTRAQFIQKFQMTKKEIDLADDMMEILSEAFPTGRQGADRFTKGVFPEASRWITAGMSLDRKLVDKFFGQEALFLHTRLESGALSPYIRDPSTFVYRTVRGRMMEDFFDPILKTEIMPALEAMELRYKGMAPGVQQAQIKRAHENMLRYVRELQGTPDKSFEILNSAVGQIFQHMGVDVPADVAQDFLQKLAHLTYKAFIPFRPLLLIRNSAEVVRLGGTVGGQDLGAGIRYVMENRKAAFEEAVKAGAIKPDLPVFPVDNAGLVGFGIRGASGRPGFDKVLRQTQKVGNKINDVTEIGMGWYQKVDELTRAVAFHSMKNRVNRFRGLAEKDFAVFKQKAKINTFDETEIMEFTRLWQSGDKNSAVDYISRVFSDNSLFLYGSANHPVGWGSAWGVMFGQFGTWPVQYFTWLGRGMTRGSFADRAQFAAWNFGAMGGMVWAGSEFDLDLRSYWGVPSLGYTGGPYADLFLDAVRLVGGNERERALARASINSTLDPTTVPTMYVPLSAAIDDMVDAVTKYNDPISGAFHEFVVPKTRE